jgi:hypothetical protein
MAKTGNSHTTTFTMRRLAFFWAASNLALLRRKRQTFCYLWWNPPRVPYPIHFAEKGIVLYNAVTRHQRRELSCTTPNNPVLLNNLIHS